MQVVGGTYLVQRRQLGGALPPASLVLGCVGAALTPLRATEAEEHRVKGLLLDEESGRRDPSSPESRPGSGLPNEGRHVLDPPADRLLIL